MFNFLLAGGNPSVGRTFFATGSNSVEVQQNAPNVNDNNSYFNREKVTTEDPGNCTTVNQIENNNEVQNSDEKPIVNEITWVIVFNCFISRIADLHFVNVWSTICIRMMRYSNINMLILLMLTMML